MKNFSCLIPTFKDVKYNILDYGALEGGEVNVSKVINECINICSNNGGGVVVVPEGLWLTGPIIFKSNVCLHLEDNAFVVFSKSSEEYPCYKGSWEGIERIRCRSQIEAHNCENIAITGNGILDARGDLWRGIKRWKLTQKEWDERLKISPYVLKHDETEIWYPTKTAYEGVLRGEEKDDLVKAQEYYDLYRPSFVSIVNCSKVLLDGPTFQNSAAWNIHPLFTNNLTIRNCHIKNPYYAQNGDGLDVESCENVEICYSTFEVGDDGICLKSGKNREARKIKVPTKNVYIHHCDVYHAHGGFVVGSEMSRGIENVLVTDCNFIGTDIGIRFKSSLGRGGVVKDIEIKNIRMTDIKEEAIIFTMGYALTTLGVKGTEKLTKEDEEDIPEFRDITISNTKCLNAKKGIVIEGLPEKPIYNITLKDSVINSFIPLKVVNGKKINLINTTLTDLSKNEKKIYNEVVEG